MKNSNYQYIYDFDIFPEQDDKTETFRKQKEHAKSYKNRKKCTSN